jgi:hypothetical protein
MIIETGFYLSVYKVSLAYRIATVCRLFGCFSNVIHAYYPVHVKTIAAGERNCTTAKITERLGIGTRKIFLTIRAL